MQVADIRASDGGRLVTGHFDRLRHDLDQGNAGPVEVDERVVGAVDASGGTADVQRLAGVLLHVSTLDLDAVDLVVARQELAP